MNSEKMKTVVIAVTTAVAGVIAGVAYAAGTVAEPQPVTTTMTAATPIAAPGAAHAAVAGSLQVTRLTDTTFVVVKDQGDAEVVTLFSTEGGIVQKKHSGHFFY